MDQPEVANKAMAANRGGVGSGVQSATSANSANMDQSRERREPRGLATPTEAAIRGHVGSGLAFHVGTRGPITKLGVENVADHVSFRPPIADSNQPPTVSFGQNTP